MALEPLDPHDLVLLARCAALDASVFPHPSIDDPRAVTVALDEGRALLGFVTTRPSRLGLEIAGLAVDPAARRRGVGRSLLNHAIAAARRARWPAVVLHVWDKNAEAIALYERAGFRRLRAVPGFYGARKAPDRGDALEMMLLLRP